MVLSAFLFLSYASRLAADHGLPLRASDIFFRVASEWCFPKKWCFSPLSASEIFRLVSLEWCFFSDITIYFSTVLFQP